MKKIGLLLLVALAVFSLPGCGKKTTVVNTDDGKVTINQTGSNSWCQAGTNWNYQGGDGMTGEWKIKELVKGGQYDNLCHVNYVAEGTTMDYYFSENGENGYYEMKLPNGQTMSQKWSK